MAFKLKHPDYYNPELREAPENGVRVLLVFSHVEQSGTRINVHTWCYADTTLRCDLGMCCPCSSGSLQWVGLPHWKGT